MLDLDEIIDIISKSLNKNWKDSSKIRNGRALIKWYNIYKNLIVQFDNGNN